jgi:phosphoglycerol transferase MdoB-like AlkP superfamily enzyme
VISFFTFAVVFLALIDALYFTFLKEHISFDFFTQLNPDNNISVWTYITDFWYMALIGLAMTALFVVWARRSFNKSSPVKWLSLIPILAVGFLVARGGFRLKPLRTADTGQYLYSSAHVVAYNAPLYLFETWRNPISTPDFISDYTKPIDPTSFQSDSLRKPNFVILILEGFGKEYTGLNRGMTHTYTPFLNSLIPKSVCCHNAYANGLKSIDAVPAIFTGLPKLSNTAIIHSPHSSQPVPSIFNLLKEIGYTSSFFHGAHNQTMGFQSYLKSNGLDNYFGLSDYPTSLTDFDSHWGIYDEPYLQHVKTQLDNQTKPFVTGIFTLSSHHPYAIPEKYRDSFVQGDIPIHKSIQYTDMAIQKFIESCEPEPWFENTIFIITADHSAQNLLHAYRTPSGKYEVPLLIYSPTLIEPQAVRKTVSHIDILPTILDYVHFPNETTFLGNSIFTPSSEQVVAHYDNNTYHISKNQWSYGITGNSPTFLYNKGQDINCLINTLGSQPVNEQELDSNLKEVLGKYFYLIKQE